MDVFARLDLITNHELAAFHQAHTTAVALQDIIRPIGLAVIGLTILGLGLNYVMARSVKPAAKSLGQEEDELVPSVERYRKPTRILHWVQASAFTILFLSGLIFFISPSGVLAQNNWLRIIHQVAAVIFIVAPLIYIPLNWKATSRGIKEAFIWGKEDLDWLNAATRCYYLCDEEAMPPQERLNTGQKAWWLLVIISWPIFIISGVIMWAFETDVPAVFLQSMVFIHDVVFIIIGSMFFVHIYMSIGHPLAHPLRTGSWRAMTRGTVSVEYAKSHHGKWYQRIIQTRQTGEK